MISIICAYNNESILKTFLIESLKNQKNTQYELILVNSKESHFNSASEALNYGAQKAKGTLLVFCHQDISFLSDNVLEQIQNFDDKFEYGIAGVAGVNFDSNIVLSSIVQGENKQNAGTPIDFVQSVATVDECLFFVKRNHFLEFTNLGKTWHLYSVEYSLRCIEEKEKVLLLPISSVWHLSPGWSLDSTYFATLNKIRKLHRNMPIIPTTIGFFRNNAFLPIYIFLKIVQMRIVRK